MSNVFDKAVEIAQHRAAFEKRVAPDGESHVRRALSEAEQSESQKLIDAFKAAVLKLAAKAAFASEAEVKAELDRLDYEKQYMPLWKMSEVCIPVTEATMVIAQELAPVRVRVIGHIAKGEFGLYVAPEDDTGALVHRADEKSVEVQRVGTAKAKEAKEAKEAQEQRDSTCSAALKEISEVISAAAKNVKSGKDMQEAIKNLDKLGGVRMVEGEKKKVVAMGQGSLFDAESAPVPKGVLEKRKRRVGK